MNNNIIPSQFLLLIKWSADSKINNEPTSLCAQKLLYHHHDIVVSEFPSSNKYWAYTFEVFTYMNIVHVSTQSQISIWALCIFELWSPHTAWLCTWIVRRVSVSFLLIKYSYIMGIVVLQLVLQCGLRWHHNQLEHWVTIDLATLQACSFNA